MNKEIKALEDNNTWVMVHLPAGKKAIGCKWVFKIKLKADGTVERFKARLVAKHYTQKFGFDLYETFSTVVKMATARCIIALAASKNWHLYQLDVNNAFLHGDLHEEVYMKAPEGYPNLDKKVFKLIKSLYGLKQASRPWFAKLLGELLKLGYIQSNNDYSLFIKQNKDSIVIAVVYVDDMILTGSDIEGIKVLKQHLDDVFNIKDLGILSFFLRDRSCLS